MQDKDILLIDKPKDITSFDVIRKLRKKLGVKKMGHAGTLDPLATGLMLIGVGDGTKKLTSLIGLSKTYEAEILLGVKTDSGDLEGKILEEKDVCTIYRTKVEEVLNSMVGKLQLPVPAYSAIKQGGEALYKKTRRGEKVNVPIKEMDVREAKLLDDFSHEDHYILKVYFDVGSGTYVRSLAEEIGDRLGLPATIKELRRTSVGEYKIKDAESLDF